MVTGKEEIINTPLELAIDNEIDRFTLAMDVIRYVPQLQRVGSSALGRLLNVQIACRNYAHQHGIDRPDIATWKWPQGVRNAVRSSAAEPRRHKGGSHGHKEHNPD